MIFIKNCAYQHLSKGTLSDKYKGTKCRRVEEELRKLFGEKLPSRGVALEYVFLSELSLTSVGIIDMKKKRRLICVIQDIQVWINHKIKK